MPLFQTRYNIVDLWNNDVNPIRCATCCNWHLFVSWILASYCSRQGPPLRKLANFDHFCPLPARPNVIWLQKVVSYTPFTYLGKVKKNWQLFPLIFFGESQKYDRGGGFRPPPHPIGLKDLVERNNGKKLMYSAAQSSKGSVMPRYLLQTSDCQCRLEADG